MFTPSHRRPHLLNLESLEVRDVASTGSWWVEPFQRTVGGLLPSGWSQWNNGKTALFAVDQAGAGLGGQGRLVSSGASWNTSRAWLTNSFAADVEASAALSLTSTAPIQLLVRGSGLSTDRPTYYAASVVRGTQVQLLQVVNGFTKVLGTVRSKEWLSNAWVQVRLRAEGDALSAFVYRGDTNQYLDSGGNWVRRTVAAVDRRDGAISTGGLVGFARPAASAGDIALDSLRIGPANTGADVPIREERFADGPFARLPLSWSSWVGSGAVNFEVKADETLRIGSSSSGTALAWMTQPVPYDVQVTSSVFVDGLVPAGLFARGSSINSNRPAYYGVVVRRGLEVDLVRVLNGQTTVIGRITSVGWQSGLWAQVSLVVKGDQIRVQIYRSDTGQYLNANGSWGLASAWAIARTDTAIRSGGLAGISRGSGSSDDLLFDNFLVNTPPGQLNTAGSIPTQADKPTTPTAPPVDPGPTPTPNPNPNPNPNPSPSSELPVVPRSNSWIRVANLAYYGTPMTSYETGLIRSGVDIVIPNLSYMNEVAKARVNTPQFVYTNISNLYLGLLTDWLEYADRNRISRESAFYHVNAATPLLGLSASAVPVNQFWSVLRGSDSTGWTDLTRDSRTPEGALSFANAGESLVVGYTEKFRQIDIDLATMAAGNWRAEIEYATTADARGNPTAWSRLDLLADGTAGLRRDGRITFDPPKNWVPTSINGGARYYSVRFRTVSALGTVPTAKTILTNDYTRFNFATSTGTIPAFDSTADLDRDGYLNDAEYARRRSGFDARFVYESRLTFPQYGPNRLATNPANASFQNWVVDYHRRLLPAVPKATGFFVDNSTGRLPTDPTKLHESASNYAVDYGNLIGRLNRSLGTGKWVIANTAGGGSSVDTLIRNGVTYLEEFALRPNTANYIQFEDLAATVRYRRELADGKAYEILDSLPQTLDVANPRTMTTTLAMYYLVADPELSFLMINGGNEPATSWTRHWTDTIRYNVGKPVGEHTLLTSGKDPADNSLTYKVYQRKYEKALVLYKPLSYIRGRSGSIGDNTRTTITLDRAYRVVNANGTLGPVVRSVSLRNGEGLVLAEA